MLKILILFSALLFTSAFADTLHENEQLLLVLTKNKNASQGIMQRYQRCTHCKWSKTGKPFLVVTGKNGLAWPVKKEGDLRSPAGVFEIDRAFGFLPLSIKIPYLKLDKNHVCVDDPESKYYNQIINTSSIAKPDWNSAEKMREISLYQYGIWIEYNTRNPVRSAGSCIFLHTWHNAHTGTAGCIAMSTSDLKKTLYWLNTKKHPVIVILTEHLYDQYKKRWNLPPL
jgi:L,D-peptidoglycan transpeptidase YkuD (ErfK/YbiS/YcfS/YnhG family)